MGLALTAHGRLIAVYFLYISWLTCPDMDISLAGFLAVVALKIDKKSLAESLSASEEGIFQDGGIIDRLTIINGHMRVLGRERIVAELVLADLQEEERIADMRLTMPSSSSESSERRNLTKFLEQQTVSKAVKKYIQDKLDRHKWVPGTARNATWIFNRFVATVGDKPVTDLTDEDVDTFKKKGFPTRTTQWKMLCRSHLKSFIKYLAKNKVIHSDITIVWEPIYINHKYDHKRIFHDFLRQDIEEICQFLPHRKYIVFLWCGCYLGLRRQNLIDSTWGMVSDDWILVIPGYTTRNGIQVRLTKNGEDIRMPIHPTLRQILGPRGRPYEKLIPGLPHPNKIAPVLKRATARAGFDPRWMYPHNLRRSCCRWLADDGVTRDEAKDLMGWKSESVMLNHYWPEISDQKKWCIMNKLK